MYVLFRAFFIQHYISQIRVCIHVRSFQKTFLLIHDGLEPKTFQAIIGNGTHDLTFNESVLLIGLQFITMCFFSSA